MQQLFGRMVRRLVVAAVLLTSLALAGMLPAGTGHAAPATAEATALRSNPEAWLEVFSDILGVFDNYPKFARLKTRFVENTGKLSPESMDKVVQMYLDGRKEQPDKLLLMKGISATASFLRSVEVAENIIRQFQTTGKIDEDGDFIGLSSGSAIREYFPRSAAKVIPFVANPADVDKLVDLMGKAITEHNAKNQAEADKYKAEADKISAENKIIQEINDMLRKVLGK